MKRLGLRKMRPSGTAIAVVVLVAGLVAGAASGIAGLTGLLHFAPALVLGAALLARRYPGERLIVRLAGSPIRAHKRVRTRAVKPREHASALVPRGGLLLARSLAVRPPPVAIRAS